MSQNWPTKTIGELCHVMTGGTPSRKKPEYFGGDIRWLVSGDVHKGEVLDCEGRITQAGLQNSNAKILPVNSVLIALNGQGKTRGTVAMLRTEATCNQSLVCMHPKNPAELLPEYLYINLQGRYQEIRRMTGDSGNDRRGLNMTLVNSIDLPVAPISVQKRIVAILDEAFEGIETAIANTERNLANARELIESFLKSVFSEGKGAWDEYKLGDTRILKIIDGDRGKNYPKKADFHTKGHCLFLNTKNVRPNGFNFDSTMFITRKKDNALRKGKLQRNDVILTTRGTVGNAAHYDDEVPFENLRINSGMLIFRPNTEKLLPAFLFEFLRSGLMKTQIARHVSGAAQPQLPIKTIVKFTIPVPKTIDAQANMIGQLQHHYRETLCLEANYQNKLSNLAELKQSIVQQAFAGELTQKAA